MLEMKNKRLKVKGRRVKRMGFGPAYMWLAFVPAMAAIAYL